MNSKALVKAELLQQDYYYDGYRLIASHSFVDFKQKNIYKNFTNSVRMLRLIL